MPSRPLNLAGSKSVSEPFANRFRASYTLEDAERKEFVKTLVRSTGLAGYICEWVYDKYERIVKDLKGDSYGTADTDSILLSLSLRSCEGALQAIAEGQKPKDAIIDSIVGKIAERDLEVATSVRNLVDGFPDLRIEGEVYDV